MEVDDKAKNDNDAEPERRNREATRSRRSARRSRSTYPALPQRSCQGNRDQNCDERWPSTRARDSAPDGWRFHGNRPPGPHRGTEIEPRIPQIQSTNCFQMGLIQTELRPLARNRLFGRIGPGAGIFKFDDVSRQTRKGKKTKRRNPEKRRNHQQKSLEDVLAHASASRGLKMDKSTIVRFLILYPLFSAFDYSASHTSRRS